MDTFGLKSLSRSYDTAIEQAYIIRIKGHEKSEELAMRAVASCVEVGMPHTLWDAFDGTGGTIAVPEHSADAEWLSWLTLTDHHLSATEVACVLSHMSLWVRCLTLDRPITILEHDAIMLAPYREHIAYNAIAYLGNAEQKEGRMPLLPIPPHGTLNHNRHFICRAHAYAIDPPMAKNIFAHVLTHGIHESLDIMIRPDLFTIVQPGLYAYDDFQGTTITNRKQDEGKER